MKNVSVISIALNCILIIAVAFLYYKQYKKPFKQDGLQNAKLLPVNASVLFINTDSIWNNYKFVKDKKAELEKYEQNLQSQYETKARNFEREYKAYLQEGKSGKLSLAEQKKREEELAKEQEELAAYDKKLSSQFIELQQKLNNQIQDSITAFIKRKNSNLNLNYVLGYSRNSGIIFANENLNITDKILEGLNREYSKKK